jgi:IS5 family transposase
MGPKPQTPHTAELFRYPLSEQLNPNHEVVLLRDAMDLSAKSGLSQRTLLAGQADRRPIRLVTGLLYLQHAHYCSDEIAVNTWVKSPDWQSSTGETFLQTESSIDS